jgi:serine/threonine protein kinase
VVVGGYEILHEIGRGGMATVYLARQLDLDRLSALKELGGLNRPDPTFARRFVREAHMAGSLSHPNIVTVYDYVTHEGTPYIAMEYLERGSLRPYVGRLSLAQLGGVLEGLLAGLARAHAAGIVHRDLKPENLLVADNGAVKIADFGIAKANDELGFATRVTATGTTIGTPEYMAPEQAMGKKIGPAADLYSVGMVALELATGRLPFAEEDSQIEVLMQQVRQPTPPARKLDPRVDRGVSDWIERLLVKDPAERVASATQAWDELEEVLIARLGARWRRGASLLDEPAEIPTPPTAPLDEKSGLAPTVLPPAGAAVAAAAAVPRRRSRGRRGPGRGARLARLVVLLAVVAGLLLAAIGGGGGGGTPAATPAIPASSTTAAPAKSTPADSGVGDSRSDDPSDDEPDEEED